MKPYFLLVEKSMINWVQVNNCCLVFLRFNFVNWLQGMPTYTSKSYSISDFCILLQTNSWPRQSLSQLCVHKASGTGDPPIHGETITFFFFKISYLCYHGFLLSVSTSYLRSSMRCSTLLDSPSHSLLFIETRWTLKTCINNIVLVIVLM